MKKVYFFAMLCIALTSCSNDDSSTVPTAQNEKELKVMNFSSEEKMEETIDEIIAFKSEKKCFN